MLFGIDYATWIIGFVALLIGIVVYKDLKNAKPNMNTTNTYVQQDDWMTDSSWSSTPGNISYHD